MTVSFGFPAAASPDAKLLILGSLPGRRSLEVQQYYAQPRNAFWPLMGNLLGVDPSACYADRLRGLTTRGVALWDVCASAHRVGSLDQRIELSSVRVNDFELFFETHPKIALICFNGATAASLYQRLVLPTLSIRAAAIASQRLPSTSPAHASLTFAQKQEKWRTALASCLD
jgi:TDG/mug DNA glycosylase family protein